MTNRNIVWIVIAGLVILAILWFVLTAAQDTQDTGLVTTPTPVATPETTPGTEEDDLIPSPEATASPEVTQ